MKICIFTMELRVSHLAVCRLLLDKGDKISLIINSTGGIGVKRASKSDYIKKTFKKSGLIYLFYQIFDFLSYPFLYSFDNFLSILGKKKRIFRWDVIANELKIPVIDAFDVNSPEIVAKVKECKPDLILSIYFDQLIGNEILSLAKFGCINLHPSLLPEFQGTNPNFWALLHNREKVGISLHLMSEKLDQGAIIAQKSFLVKGFRSLMAIDSVGANMGGDMLVDLVQQLENGDQLIPIPQDLSKRSFFSLPEKKHLESFWENNQSLFTFADLWQTDRRTKSSTIEVENRKKEIIKNAGI